MKGETVDFINFIDIPLTPKESNFVGQVGADLLIKTGEVPSNTKILRKRGATWQ